ncbi:hypothetical protein, partial [Streptococcus suis]
MNKRMKKKWSQVERLENKVAQLTAENILLTDALRNHADNICDLYDIVERNAQATNSRFDKIEQQVANCNAKKSWFSRKWEMNMLNRFFEWLHIHTVISGRSCIRRNCKSF